ncbi:MAG TPA: type III PLP-dependent enzyme [Alphaproteobacteria bacterium]|nr:type III PLP-dependent enzyme [Alphaproteobacteria bacterium]USO06535.1 MAG: type III PLP-dependent enzyme [Rhodospirillales bacterium]HOO82247.1 type III PLP-dependent enzyme [Alphaproteobacteria bacterium]
MTDDTFQGSLEASALTFSHSDQISFDDIPPRSGAADIDSDVIDDYIRTLRPTVPVAILKPQKLSQRAKEFTKSFTGCALYAVKCNPDEVLLKTMYANGVRRFDVASISEVRLIRGLFPRAKIYFMHPIKAPEAIHEAYINHKVRAFVLDYADELDKILYETNAAADLELFVRLAVPKDNQGSDVATDFSSKFGAKPEYAAELLRLCRPYCKKLGLSFHVGTQCQDPSAYSKAIAHAANVIEESGVSVDVLDIGGGFPAELDTENPMAPIQAFTREIEGAVRVNGLKELELLCEIGRGLVACAGALVVRVEGRKDDLLYLNDGTYGGLFEAGGSIGLAYPAHLIRREERSFEGPVKPFRFAGPTCDSVDMMKGPFMLPADVQTGDWIRLEQLGAYGEVSRTDFNGFGSARKIVV